MPAPGSEPPEPDPEGDGGPALDNPPAGTGAGQPEQAAEPAERLGFVRMLRTGDGFRRLLVVRFSIQWADGMFQAALGGAVLFNPERQADPLAVAAGLA